MLQLPKNTNIDNLVETLIECNCGPVAAIEKIMTNNKLSQLFFYVGEERFTGVPDCRLYAAIYKDIGHEHK